MQRVDPGLYVSHVNHLRMIVVLTIPDNALLRKLRVLHPTKFWIFPPIDKNSVLSRKRSPAIIQYYP